MFLLGDSKFQDCFGRNKKMFPGNVLLVAAVQGTLINIQLLILIFKKRDWNMV